MITCKYCGSNLIYIGEYKSQLYFACDFCDMTFDKSEVCRDRKRMSSVPEYYTSYMLPTKSLLERKTIELFHMLKECRKDWYDIFSLLKWILNVDPNEITDNQELDEAYKPLYKEYISLTKQKFVIENVILEKAGFLPDKITDEFLGELVRQGRSSSEKPMYIYINND